MSKHISATSPYLSRVNALMKTRHLRTPLEVAVAKWWDTQELETKQMLVTRAGFSDPKNCGALFTNFLFLTKPSRLKLLPVIVAELQARKSEESSLAG